MHPNGKPAETEKAWFTAALQHADALAPVATLAPAGEPNPIDWVYTNIYGAERSGLMHAKPGLYHLPQDDAGRAGLRASLRVLSGYVDELVGVVLNVRRNFSGFSTAGWRLFAEPFFDHMALIVAEEELPRATWDDETIETVRRKYLNQVRSGTQTIVEEPLLITGLSVVDGPYLRSLHEIRTIAGVGPLLGAELKVLSELTGPITLGSSVTRFEVVIGLRNLNMPDLPNFSA